MYLSVSVSSSAVFDVGVRVDSVSLLVVAPSHFPLLLTGTGSTVVLTIIVIPLTVIHSF